MMRKIKKIAIEDFEDYYKINNNAYPIVARRSKSTKEEHLNDYFKKVQNSKNSRIMGYYLNNKLVATMRLFDFEMNIFGNLMPVGGLGSLAVDLLYKKQRIAKEMIEYFINHCKQQHFCFSFLYPFEHKFYKQMGYGYGTKNYNYIVPPSSFSKGTAKNLSFISVNELDKLLQFYNEKAYRTHGMILRPKDHYEDLLKDCHNKILIYKENEKILGYIHFSFEKVSQENRLTSNFKIHEWLWDDPKVLKNFCYFLNKQSDQCNKVIFETFEENLFHLLIDPRNEEHSISDSLFHPSHTSSLGMMVRSIDSVKVLNILNALNFDQIVIGMKFNIMDSFLNTVHEVKIPNDLKEITCSVNIDISSFSSLLFGAISFQDLYKLDLVTLSDKSKLEIIDSFFTKIKPECFDSF